MPPAIAPVVVQHTVGMSNTAPNANFNGAARDAGDSALVLAKCALKVTWSAADVSYGHLERGCRRNLLALDGS